MVLSVFHYHFSLLSFLWLIFSLEYWEPDPGSCAWKVSSLHWYFLVLTGITYSAFFLSKVFWYRFALEDKTVSGLWLSLVSLNSACLLGDDQVIQGSFEAQMMSAFLTICTHHLFYRLFIKAFVFFSAYQRLSVYLVSFICLIFRERMARTLFIALHL